MTEIENWMRSGAEVQEGLRLLGIYKPNKWLACLVERHPDKYRDLLIRTLTGVGREEAGKAVAGDGRFRKRWTFLADDDCPMELKILAADKITAWTRYARSHDKLYSCVSQEDCLKTAKDCVFSYCQNRKIYSEFAYYQEHKSILGKHEIFAEVKRLKELRASGPVKLLRRQHRLQESLWRLRRLMEQGDRPDLDLSRTESILSKERELAEIERLIQEYDGQKSQP